MRNPAVFLAVIAAALAGLLLLAVAGADEEDPITPEPVTVTTDRSVYRLGEPVQVTIDNGMPTAIYAPVPGGCSVVTLSQLINGQWVPVGICPNPNVIPVSVPGQSSLAGVFGAPPPPPSAGVVVIGPVAPSTSRDLTTLPTVAPWQPGDPVRTIPEGAIAAPFGPVGPGPGSGTYRLELVFAAGLPSGVRGTAYSGAFVITD
jgi:hypothetical protein